MITFHIAVGYFSNVITYHCIEDRSVIHVKPRAIHPRRLNNRFFINCQFMPKFVVGYDTVPYNAT